jgi:hypothetical protein
LANFTRSTTPDSRPFEAVPVIVRLIRHVASTGTIRLLMTNLFDAQRFPFSCLPVCIISAGAWKKRSSASSTRLALKHVSGLSELAAMQDLRATVLCTSEWR